MYLLDTNVVSELRKPRPHRAVVSWIERIADTDLYLCAVTLGEIQAGIEITREQDAIKADEIEAWADQVATAYNVLPMDTATFRQWARLMHRQSNTMPAVRDLGRGSRPYAPVGRYPRVSEP